jgi:dTDP-4-dehydrorhamnose reductase
MLGRALIETAPAAARLAAYPRRALDLLDGMAVADALDRHRPEWVLNAAAWTRVDDAEQAQAEAFAANADAVGTLGVLAAVRGAAVLHVSTDYVFPGAAPRGDDGAPRPWREDDPTAPLNVYGQSKLAGERALATSGAAWCVARTQWLYGAYGRSFPRTMLARARAGTPSRVVDDQHGAPTHVRDLAAALWALAAAGARGVVHATNAGQATWCDVAREVYALAGADPALVTPCASADFPTPARRPAWGVLDGARLREAYGVAMRDWRAPLAEFCRDERA